MPSSPTAHVYLIFWCRLDNRYLAKRERSRESACFQCGFTPLAGDTKTMKTEMEGELRLQTHPFSDRPAIDMLRRTSL